MITKRNTYKPHYFGFGGGDFQEVTEEGNSAMYQQQLAKQGLGQESGTNWGNVGMGAAGAASGLMGQIGVSEKNPNGLWDAADPMHYLANGRTSKFGEGASKLGIGLTQAGLQSGNPWLAVAGAAVKIVGDLGNAGWGHKTNEEQLARINQGIDAANNFQSNAYSFDTLQDPMTLASAGNVYEGGWFNKKKWRKKNEELQANVAEAQANVYNQFNNNVSNLQQDQMNNMLANYAAFGGPLHTHGSDWTNGITYVDNGGSHESNPHGGVPMGIAQDGQPNLVEEGEVIYKLNGSPYVYSKRLKMSKELKDKYKFKGDTFADGALEAQKESEERPNDPISQRGLNAIMSDLANEQEKKRAEKAERQAKYAFGGHLFPWGGRVYFNGNIYRKTEKGDYVPESGVGQTLLESDLDKFWRGAGGAGVYDVTPEIENEYNRLRNSGLSLSDIDNGMINYIALGGMERRREAKAAAFGRLPTQGFVSQKPVNTEVANQVESNEIEAAKPVEAVPLTDQMAGNIYYGTAPSPLQQNSGWSSGWRSFLLTPDIATTPLTTTNTTTPSTSTPTSKSTSTGKSTGTTTSRGTTTTNSPVDYGYLLDWMGDEANFAAANAAATKNGARNFTNAADLYKTATTGKPGPAMRGLLSAYNDFQNANRGGINYNPYNEGSPETEALSSIPITNSIPTLGSLSPERYQDIESANRLNYFTGLYGDEAAKKLKKAGFNPDGTRKEEYTGTNTAVDSNKELKDYRTWMRYAPIFGSGLALALDPWINRPDYTNADLVLEAGKSAGNVDFTPIGDYLPYKPYDRLFYANQLAANQAATRRALLNTTGGNAAAARGLLLAADNQGINQMGNLWRQAEEYNEANRQAVAEFNRGTNMFNSEGRLKADMANQGQANVRINAAIEAAKLRALEDDRVAETRSANFTNFLDNLGDLGRENLYYNMVNNNKALYYGALKNGQSPYKGEGSTNNPVTMPVPIQQYTKTGKNGGYLTIKKKKR